MRRRTSTDRDASASAGLEGPHPSDPAGFAAYLLYELVRAVVVRQRIQPGYKPFGDATKIIDLERTLHVFVEPSIQAWAPNSTG